MRRLLLILALALPCYGQILAPILQQAPAAGGGGSAPTIIQQNGNSGGSNAQFGASFSNSTSNLTAGNAMICLGFATTTAPTAVAGTVSGAFTQVTGSPWTPTGGLGQIPFAWVKSSLTGGAEEITWNPVGTSTIECFEVQAGAVVDANGAHYTANGASDTITTAAVSTIFTSESNSGNHGIASGYTCWNSYNNQGSTVAPGNGGACPQAPHFHWNVGYKAQSGAGASVYTEPAGTGDILQVPLHKP